MRFDEAQQVLRIALENKLIEERDTSVLFYNTDRLDQLLSALKDQFPGRQSVAIKTCPVPSVLQRIVQAGLALEAASVEEVRLAFSNQVGARHVIFDSPVKTKLEIEEVAQNDHIVLNANSLAELDRIPADIKCKVGLRINPLIDTAGPEAFQVSSGDSKFGVPIKLEEAIVHAFTTFPFLTGLHMHIGSDLETFGQHVNAVRKMVQLASKINRQRQSIGWPEISFIDIGGGIKSSLSVEKDIRVLSEYKNALDGLPGLFDRFDVITEFGQLIHATNGFIASRVEYTREIEGIQQVFIHVGADLFTRKVYAGLGNAIEVAVLDQQINMKSEAKKRSQIVGPLCFAGDVLETDMRLPEVSEGDWMILTNGMANTYGLWSRHCSRDVPKVLMYSPEQQQTTIAHERKQVW